MSFFGNFLTGIFKNKAAIGALVSKMEIDSAIIILPDKANGALKILQCKWEPLDATSIRVNLGVEISIDNMLNLDAQIMEAEATKQNALPDGPTTP